MATAGGKQGQIWRSKSAERMLRFLPSAAASSGSCTRRQAEARGAREHDLAVRELREQLEPSGG